MILKLQGCILGLKQWFFSLVSKDERSALEKARDFIAKGKYKKLSQQDKLLFASNFITLVEQEKSRKAMEQKPQSESYIPKNNEVLKYYIQRKGIQEKYIKMIDFLYQQVFEYDFIKTSSVSEVLSTENGTIENQFDILKKFDLEFHTLGVFQQAIEITKSEEDNFSAKVVILALAHDFGKSPEVRRFVNIGPTQKIQHNIISGMYIERVCINFNMKEEGAFFRNILSNHHFKKKEGGYAILTKEEEEIRRNIFIKLLNQADRRQRERELDIYGAEEIAIRDEKEKEKEKEKMNKTPKEIVITSKSKITKVEREIKSEYGDLIEQFALEALDFYDEEREGMKK